MIKVLRSIVLSISLLISTNLNFGIANAQSNTVTESNASGQKGKIQLESTEKKGSTVESILLILNLAAAYSVFKLLTSCDKPTYDLYGAMGSAGIYLMGEMMALQESKQGMKAKTIEYKTYSEDQKIDDEQYEVLLKEKQLLEQIKKTAEKRAKMQNASAIGYTISAGIATYLALQKFTLEQQCTALCPLLVPEVTFKSQIEMKYEEVCKAYTITTLSSDGIASKAQDKVCWQEQKLVTKMIPQTEIKESSVAVACDSSTSLGAPVSKSCVDMSHSFSRMVKMQCTPLVAGITQNEKIEKWYSTLMKNFFSKAHANKGLATVLGFLGGYLATTSSYIVNRAYLPKMRAYLWGALAILTKIVSNNTKKTADSAQRNIDIIDQLLDKMESTMEKSVSVNSGSSATGISGTGNNTSATTYPSGSFGDIPLDCAAGGRPGQCNKMPGIPNVEKLTKMPGLPSSLKGGFNDLMGALGGAQGRTSLSPRTGAKINSLLNHQKAAGRFLKRSGKKLDELRKKAGMKPANIEASSKKMAADMVKGTSKHYKNKGINPNSKLASFGSRGGSLFNSGAAGNRGNGMSDAQKAAGLLDEDLNGGKGLQDSLGGEGLGEAGAGGNGEFNFEFDQEAIDAEVAAKNAAFEDMAAQAAKIEGSEESSIIEDPTVSIWKVLSTRYLKSGYKKLLEEVKE